MSAYCFFNVLEINDPELMEEYRSKVFDTVEAHGGRYRLIGGDIRKKEGDWMPAFPVLIEFPDMASAEAWYHSEEYRPLLKLRLAATKCEAVFMESPGLAS